MTRSCRTDADRRRDVRYRCDFAVHVEGSISARTCDISPSGMRITGAPPLVSEVRVSGDPRSDVFAGETVSCNVTWCSDNEFGLEFREMPRVFAQNGNACRNRRQKIRRPIRLEAGLRSPEWRLGRKGVVVSLSSGGAEIEASCPLHLHQVVFLEFGPSGDLPALRLYGRVRWLRTSTRGCRVAGICFAARSEQDLGVLRRYCTLLRNLRADSDEGPGYA